MSVLGPCKAQKFLACRRSASRSAQPRSKISRVTRKSAPLDGEPPLRPTRNFFVPTTTHHGSASGRFNRGTSGFSSSMPPQRKPVLTAPCPTGVRRLVRSGDNLFIGHLQRHEVCNKIALKQLKNAKFSSRGSAPHPAGLPPWTRDFT